MDDAIKDHTIKNDGGKNDEGDQDGAGKKDPPSIGEFSDRLDRLRGAAEPKAPKPSGAAWGRAMRTSSELLAGLIVGGLLGFGVDVWLETKPWFLLAGIGVGFAAGVRNLMRSLKQESDTSSDS